MGYTCFDVAIDDGIAHLRMCRPDRFNSMIPEFWSELPEIVDQIHGDASARVIVVSSEGKHFTSGMDLSVFTGGNLGGNAAPVERGRAAANSRAHILHLQESFTVLERARMPVLAAIQGGCIGGGVDLASACDVRYCSADAFFCIQEINIGITADVGTLQRLPKIIPDGVVRELAYTGRRMPAHRALEVGLVNQVFEDADALVAGVLEVAREIASRSPLAIWGTKEMLNYSRDHSVADGLNYIATWNAGVLGSTDMAEAFAAKSEKRDPRFADLPPLRKGL